MAAITTAAVVTAGAAYSANRKGAAAKKQGQAAASASQQALDLQGEIYDQSVQQAQPYMQAGTTALAQLQAVNDGDYSGFENAPDYQFARQQGLQGLDRSAAARGGLYGGGHTADTLSYASGLAGQQLGNYTGRLTQLAQMGQNQTQYLGQLGQGQAQMQSSTLGALGQAKGQAAASGALAQAGYGEAIGAGVGAYMGYTNGGTSRKSGYGS